MKKIYIPLLPLPLKKYIGVLLLLLFCTTSALAEENLHMLPIPLEERVKQSNLIVEGEVISQRSFWGPENKSIYTSSIIQVYKVFKGDLQGQQVEIITEGGAVGLKVLKVSNSLKLHKGQQGTFFLNNQKQLATTPAEGLRSTEAYGSQQGIIAYDVPANTAADVFNKYSTIESMYKAITAQTKRSYRTIAQNHELIQAKREQAQRQDAQFAPVITSFSPTVTSAGTGAILTINGSGFGNTRGNGSVEFKNADDGGQTYTKPYPREYISWTNTQIKLYVPSYGQDQGTAGSGVFRVTANDGTSVESNTPITIEFAHLNVALANVDVQKNRTFKIDLQDNDGTGGYTIQYAPSMQSNIPAQYGFQRAVVSWVCNTGVNWKIGEPSNREVSEEKDGRNVVGFASASVVGDRTLASTRSWYEGWRCGNDTVFFLAEFDMMINSAINWQYGPGPPTNRQYDFETVMLHELGHALQLGHIIRPREAIMHYSVAFDVTYRDLIASDIEGANLIIARSTAPNVCGEPPMVPIPREECNIFANITNQETVYIDAGSVEVRWSSTEEDGLDYYVVERSKNGIDYTEVGTVDAKGDNSSYTFVDTNPLPFRSFYRIRAVYTNDTSRYSTRMAITDPEARDRLIVAPNPVAIDGKTSIYFLTTASVPIEYYLYDITGKILFYGKTTFNDVVTEQELDLSNVASGIYLLKWSSRNDSGTVKILVP